MGFRCSVLACAWALLCLAPPCASAQEEAAVPQWAEDFLRSWYAAYNRGDAVAVASFFTSTAKLGPDQGRGAIQGSLNKAFSKTNYNCTGRFESIREIGDLAVGWGVDTCTETPKPIGSPATTKERWLAVFERQPDGRWLISRETWQDLVP
jgi:ketosteroid isomerase-like protein